jgi:hypothetical protein
MTPRARVTAQDSLHVHVFFCLHLCVTEDYVYTEQTAPTAWLAPEVFVDSTKGRAGKVATAASDMFMLGCCYLELATKCTRTPYDWLRGFALTGFRWHDSTRTIGPIQVTMMLACLLLLYSSSAASAVVCGRICGVTDLLSVYRYVASYRAMCVPGGRGRRQAVHVGH